MPYHEGIHSKQGKGENNLLEAQEFCEVKFECRECRIINGPRITRIVEGQVKRIKL